MADLAPSVAAGEHVEQSPPPASSSPSGSLDPEFNEDEIRRMVAEVLHFDLSGWNPMYEDTRFKAWRKMETSGTIYRYRLRGTINATPEQFYALYTDLTHWKEWDTNVQELRELGRDSSGLVRTVYWSVKYPFPFSNRDYVFKRYASPTDANTWVIYSKCTTDAAALSKEPPKYGVVRVSTYSSFVCLRRAEDGRTEMVIDSLDDPQSALPEWVFSWLTTRAMQSFIDTLEREVAAYPAKPAHNGQNEAILNLQ